MRRALIVYASRHGATAGIAERIGEQLRAADVDAVVVPAADQPDPTGFDACVAGSGVYMGSWLKEGIEYLERNVATLGTRPTWLFSSGPIPNSTKERSVDEDRYGGALGPADGPGSGGRKKIESLAELIGVPGDDDFSDVGGVPAGKELAFDVSYKKTTDTLSVSHLEIQPVVVGDKTPGRVSLDNYLPYIIGGLGVVLIAGGLGYYWQSGRTDSKKSRRRQRVRADREENESDVHCSQCGTRARSGDRFCRTCGSRIRQPEE
jgi:hypothetical protein